MMQDLQEVEPLESLDPENELTGLSIEDFNMSNEKWNMNYDT